MVADDISSHDINYVEYVGPGLTWGRILNASVISMWSNDIKCKFMFMFPLKNLALKELRFDCSLGSSGMCFLGVHGSHIVDRSDINSWYMELPHAMHRIYKLCNTQDFFLYFLEYGSGLAFTESPNRKGLGKGYKGLEKFDVSSPILCCFLGQ